MTAAEKAKQRTELLSEYRTRFPVGTQFYIVKHGRSESGREYFDVFKIHEDGYPLRVTGVISDILGWTYNRKRECLQVNCGGGLAQEVEYALTKALIPAKEIKPREKYFRVHEMI